MDVKKWIRRGCRYMTDKDYRFLMNAALGMYNHMPDEEYLKREYKARLGKDLNLETPKTFNEKIQWLKLHDRNPEYVKMVDKYEVKKYVAGVIGEQYIIPTLGVWDRFEDIEFDRLPEQFVLKCTHDSGGVVIVRDKKTFNKKEARKKIERSLRRNYYYPHREWPYKDVKPRILAEQYMVDESGRELKDYKAFCFDGEPKIIQVDYDRFVAHKRNLYTTDWDYIEAEIEFPTDPSHQIDRPQKLKEMLNLAKKLSGGASHVRVDFYSIEDRLYFGELTFHHGAGFEKFCPESFGFDMGSWIRLPGGGIS